MRGGAERLNSRPHRMAWSWRKLECHYPILLRVCHSYTSQSQEFQIQNLVSLVSRRSPSKIAGKFEESLRLRDGLSVQTQHWSICWHSTSGSCVYVYWKKSATCSWRAELRLHKIIILNKINEYLNWIILKRWITKLDVIHVIYIFVIKKGIISLSLLENIVHNLHIRIRYKLQLETI